MSNGIAHNNLNDISKIYLETISDINKKEQEDDVKRWQQEESECGQNTRQQSPFKKKKVKAYKEAFSNWRKDLREVTSDAEAVEVDDQPEIKEKKVKNKIKINPEFKEAVKQIGGELLEVKEVDSPDGETKDDNKSDDKKAEQDEAKKKKIADKERKLKMRILRVKMMATKQDAGASIVAGYEPEGEVVSELSRSTLSSYIQKGARDIAGKANDASIKGMSGKRKEADKGYEKTAKRVAGVSKAAGKLALKGTIYDKSTNEEVEVDEGSAYGLYKGSGKPSGPMAAFGKKKKDKKKKEEVQEKVLDRFETGEKERIVKGMKKDTKGFKKRYGDKWKSVMYATATKHAKEAGDTSKSDKRYAAEGVKRDEYGDPVGGPKISKKQKAKNLSSNTPDEKHTTTTSEAKVDKGRSDYGKATIRNWRHSGPSTVEPAMFDPENKRGKTIDKRREEHKARRGVKGAKVPTYKKEEVEIDEATRYKKEKGYDKGGTKKPSGKKDPALSAVVSMIRKKHGKSAIIGQGSRQQKKVRGAKSSTVGKYKKAADEKKQLKKDAKEMGYGSDTKGYIETRARYGSKENMKSGRGLGT